MSRIIVEKELNKKPQQPQSQHTGYVNVIYDMLNSNNQNLSANSNATVKTNSISNPPSTPQISIQENANSQQIHTQTFTVNQQQAFAPIIQISPFKPITPLTQPKNQEVELVSEPQPAFPNIYNTTYNILGTEMTSQEADDLFDNAEKLVGWSYWKINQ